MTDSPPDKPRARETSDLEKLDEEASPSAPTRILTQEEIARRVEALAKDEDEGERIARVEEEKLADRRAAQKGKRSGLEIAASKRLAKIGEKSSVARAVPAAVEQDALFEKTAHLGKFLERNAKTVGYVIFGGLVLSAGLLGMNSLREKKEAKASADLTAAMWAQSGRVGDPDKETKETEARYKDPAPLFKTDEERREAALKQYREVTAKYAGTGAGILARLAEGALLLDKREGEAAMAAFRDVKDSPLGKVDVDVRARALEGMGFAHELEAAWDDAFVVYKELEATDVVGFKELGIYHQARVLEAKGDKEKAKTLLKGLLERVSKPDSPLKNLERLAEDRLRAIDPAALPAKPSAPPDIQKMIEQMRLGGAGGKLPKGAGP